MKQSFIRFLADLRFSIFILLLISFCSILGTVIEQDQSVEVYKLNYSLAKPAFAILSWNQILQLGLDHVYKTWWFITLIFLFGLSLTLCSFLQQLPSLKITRRCQFFRTTRQFTRLKISTILIDFSFAKLVARVKKQKYSIFHQKNSIYCYKGLSGRIGPLIVHFSMILILFGTIISSLTGFKAQEVIPKTETFHIQNILNTGSFTTVPKTSVRLNDFWITYTPSRTIAQFYSNLSILDDKANEIVQKTVFVNCPLIFNGIYYYQTDWSLVGLRFQNFKNQVLEYPLVNISNRQEKVWLTWISNNQSLEEGVLIIADNLEGYCSLYNELGAFSKSIEINEIISFDLSLVWQEILSSTGLQIKTDPGISLIYLGFLFLMISTLVSYTTYSQVWFIQKNQKIFIGGSTNRAVLDFELEFFKLVK